MKNPVKTALFQEIPLSNYPFLSARQKTPSFPLDNPILPLIMRKT
jgi:hypothetical protein